MGNTPGGASGSPHSKRRFSTQHPPSQASAVRRSSKQAASTARSAPRTEQYNLTKVPRIPCVAMKFPGAADLTTKDVKAVVGAVSYSTSSYCSLTSSYSGNSVDTPFLQQQANLAPALLNAEVTGLGVCEYGRAVFFGHVPAGTRTSREANLDIFRGLTDDERLQSNAQLAKIREAKAHSDKMGDADPVGPSDVLLRVKGIAKSIPKIISERAPRRRSHSDPVVAAAAPAVSLNSVMDVLRTQCLGDGGGMSSRASSGRSGGMGVGHTRGDVMA
ncbi:hypothetical protein TeGR_g1931 [Tetraparma gracilis]|uniref:Uncharacterized protein n=1 Tax=Tetraparma gracilis TaxID=2962635 RepID=A0ABQ6MR29_9STRA|nr:hypothetical protein TeGR_g1931 [Tetraparma gracilis]